MFTLHYFFTTKLSNRRKKALEYFLNYLLKKFPDLDSLFITRSDKEF